MAGGRAQSARWPRDGQSQWRHSSAAGSSARAEDFGYQGELPTHPELLDWLAVELVSQGWSLKQMLRLIVTSATYQQSSRLTPTCAERDPQNVLLARGPRFRLEAELIRDTALRASGLLSGKIGGPSVFPPQPPASAREGTYGPSDWKTSTGEDRYRRGLYTFAKRTAPYAMTRRSMAPVARPAPPARNFEHAAASPDAAQRRRVCSKRPRRWDAIADAVRRTIGSGQFCFRRVLDPHRRDETGV